MNDPDEILKEIHKLQLQAAEQEARARYIESVLETARIITSHATQIMVADLNIKASAYAAMCSKKR